jgi:uncharacterized protein YbjT (DUF2867 family)
MYVIAGVTGHTGKVAAETLLAQGQKIRVVVRRAGKGAELAARGAEVAVASLDDEAAMTRAFAGAAGAYLLSPPSLTSPDLVAERRPMFEALARAARAARLPHVVLLSSIGAQHDRKNGPIKLLHHAEHALGAATAVTAVRAGYFLENWAGVLPMAKQDGVLPSFLPATLPMPTVATPDIGRVAAEALVAGPRGRRIVELGGPTDPTATDVAAAASRVLGRPVKVQEAPLAAVVPTFTSFGLSEGMARLYQEMYAGILDGTVAWEPAGAGTERVRGRIGLDEGFRALAGSPA